MSTPPDSEPLTDRATLHRVERKVRLLPGHPLYWDYQYGILYVWLYADSTEGAKETAKKIITALPYEWAGGETVVCKILPRREEGFGVRGQEIPSDEAGEQFEIRAQMARELGFALLFAGEEVGADEEEFETSPLR